MNVKVEGAQALQHGSDQANSLHEDGVGHKAPVAAGLAPIATSAISDSVHAVPRHPLHDAGLPPGLVQDCPTCGKFLDYFERYLQALGKVPIGTEVDLLSDKAVIKITIPQKLVQGSETVKAYVEPVPIKIFSDSESDSTPARLPQSETSSDSEVVSGQPLAEQPEQVWGGELLSLETTEIAQENRFENDVLELIGNHIKDLDDDYFFDDFYFDEDVDIFYECEEKPDGDRCPPLWPHECETIDLCPLPQAVELNKLTATTPNLPGEGWVRMAEDITLDSGASHSVNDGAKYTPDWPLSSSEASRRGVNYIGPDGGIIPNKGERKGKMGFENGIIANTCYQEGGVRKPLLAVADVLDQGNISIFSNQGNIVAPMSDPAVKKILELLSQIKTGIHVHRVNNTFRIPAWIQKAPKPEAEASSVFIRQPRR